MTEVVTGEKIRGLEPYKHPLPPDFTGVPKYCVMYMYTKQIQQKLAGASPPLRKPK